MPNRLARSSSSRTAALILLAQAAVIAAFSVFYLVELALGQGEDRMRVAMSVVVFLIGAAALVALARGLARGHSWARTPSLLWNVLLLPVAVSLVQSHQAFIGVLLGAAAVVGIAAVLRGGPTS